MSGRELYKIMIKNDLDFVIDKIIEKNNDLTIKELKIEELEKENYNNVVEISRLKRKVEQLENIRKEAIKYVQEKADYPISYYHCLNDLLNILNKGSD